MAESPSRLSERRDICGGVSTDRPAPPLAPPPTDADALTAELGQRLNQTAAEVVPGFCATMPRRYWLDTDRDDQLGHLSAIVAARAADVPVRLTLKSADESEWTLIHDQDYPGLLAELLTQVPLDRPLRSAKVHTSSDRRVVIDVFRFGAADVAPERFDDRDPAQAERRAQILAAAAPDASTADAGPNPSTADASHTAGVSLTEFIAACPAYLVTTVAPERLARLWMVCRALFGTDDTQLALQREESAPDLDPTARKWRIVVASGNAAPNGTFARIAAHLGRASVDIRRAYLDRLDDGAGRSVLLFSYIIEAPQAAPPEPGQQGPKNGPFGPDSATWQRLAEELPRLRWLDDRVLDLLDRHPHLGMLRAELAIALGHLIHSSLARENQHAFSNERIRTVCERHLDLTTTIVDLFLARFHPTDGLAESDCDGRIATLLARIEAEVDDPASRRILSQLLLVIQATRYTNAYVHGRYGLAIRFDPTHLNQPQPGDAPYGVFFVHGRGFNGYHVRFRDIARGGLRVVRPGSLQQHALESERVYAEAYGLALAQQLKNKDIPEGGAKAVILCEPGVSINDSVKAFGNSLLDLICPNPALRARVANPHQLDERIYLGPDENISPALIEWIVDRAERRGYPTPGAFMSSKPGAGINHKEYGVTSEGVTVFLEEALRESGIDPRRQPFTVKLTGGPDGDVAGNELKILQREFGENARVVGIADGSGCAEDPDGLDHGELLRLFAAALPIAHFDRDRLGPRGQLASVTDPGGVEMRNTMHNRVKSDAFVPAGGRPETIHEGNWQLFAPDGVPSSRVIVEGANLYITPAARHALATQAGVLIVKDSSANKCGVICSSFEILASMLLTPAQFLADKERFVREVIERLRALARSEAKLLFREHRRDPSVALPDLSVRLSQTILTATDAIEDALSDALAPALGDDSPGHAQARLLDATICAHLPPVLVERAGDRLRRDVPPRYWSSMVAATLATNIVYREGLDYLAHLDRHRLAALALSYLQQEQETNALIAELDASALPHRQRIAALLRAAGTRAGLALGPEPSE